MGAGSGGGGQSEADGLALRVAVEVTILDDCQREGRPRAPADERETGEPCEAACRSVHELNSRSVASAAQDLDMAKKLLCLS